MSGWRFALRQVPALRVDLRGITPAALAGLSPAEVERLPLGHGNTTLPLAELFSVARGADSDVLTFDGDLSRFDRVGWQMAGGRIQVEGPAGHYAGGCMSAGELVINGHAGLLAACEMAGGTLTIEGDVDDFAAGTLPGSMDGMRGGVLVVKGNAGARFGDRMRRGTALVFGDAGDFARVAHGRRHHRHRRLRGCASRLRHAPRQRRVRHRRAIAGAARHLRAGAGCRRRLLATAGTRPGRARRPVRGAGLTADRASPGRSGGWRQG